MPIRARRTTTAVTVASLFASTLAAIGGGGVAHATGGSLSQLTARPDGAPVYQGAYDQTITADNRFVAFTTAERYLPSIDVDVAGDVYILDRSTGRYTLATVDANGNNLASEAGDSIGLTADGRQVVFTSGDRYDDTPVTPATESSSVWVRDVSTGSIELVSRGGGGDTSYNARMTPSGRFVVYTTGPYGHAATVVRHDRATNTEIILTTDGDSSSVSDDGSRVSWIDAAGHAFVATIAADGTFSVVQADLGGDGTTTQAGLSADGSLLAMASSSTNLVPGVDPGPAGLGPFGYVVDLDHATVTFGAVRSDGVPAGHVLFGDFGASQLFSADNRYLVFGTDNALTTVDLTGHSDVFVHDRTTGRTTRVSVRNDGSEMPPIQTFGAGPENPIISADGSQVVFYYEGPLFLADRTGEHNVAPVAAGSLYPATGQGPLAVSFSPSGSYDPDVKVDYDTIVSYCWDFDGDGTIDRTDPSYATFQHTYAPGSYLPTLTVVDRYGLSSTVALDPVTVTVPPPTYDQLVLGDHPSAYFRLGESAGPVAHDSSPTALDGTYSATVAHGLAGAIPLSGDTAAAFDAKKSNVAIGDRNLVDGSAWTIEAWVRPGVADKSSWIYDDSSGATVKVALRLDPATGTKPLLQVKDDAGVGGTVTGPSSIVDGAWHHLVATRNGRVITLYVDGVQVATKKLKVLGVTTSDGATIGAQRTGTSFLAAFNGSIDEVALYPTALSAVTAAAHHDNGVSGGGGGGGSN